MSLIKLNHSSSKPKYQQVINSIIASIDNKELKVGDKIASVNEVAESTGLAKKTIVQAFEHLKKTGVIQSVKYKGYFVASTKTDSKHNIFILFNNLTTYKEEIYESIKNTLGTKGIVDIYFHHDNIDVFNTLIEKSAGKYTEYIIMPMNDKAIKNSLALLPQDKVYILDIGFADWGKKYPSVCQFFDMDIHDVMVQALIKIKRYKKLVLISGNPLRYNAIYTQKGFKVFCTEYNFDYDILEHLQERTPQKDELYIVIEDVDLVHLVKKINRSGLKQGRDVGIISYNEFPFKEIVGDGIATISTDFEKMGANIINMIINKSKAHLRNESRLIDRKSF